MLAINFPLFSKQKDDIFFLQCKNEKVSNFSVCATSPTIAQVRKKDKKMMWKSGFLHFLPRFFPIKEFFTSDTSHCAHRELENLKEVQEIHIWEMYLI